MERMVLRCEYNCFEYPRLAAWPEDTTPLSAGNQRGEVTVRSYRPHNLQVIKQNPAGHYTSLVFIFVTHPMAPILNANRTVNPQWHKHTVEGVLDLSEKFSKPL